MRALQFLVLCVSGIGIPLNTPDPVVNRAVVQWTGLHNRATK